MLKEDLFPNAAQPNGIAFTCHICGAIVHIDFTDEHYTFHKVVREMHQAGRDT